MAQVIVDEAGDEIVAVVIARMHTQRQRMPGSRAGVAQFLRLQLLDQETVGLALIDQQGQAFAAPGNQFAGVPFLPRGAVVAEVARKSLLSPGAGQCIADRREGRQRAVATGVAQRTDQRPVAAHRMAADATPCVDRQAGFDKRRQLEDDIVVHAVVLGPRLPRRVQVETGAVTEIPGAFGVARHRRAARAGVGGDDRQAQFGGDTQRTRFLHEVLVAAGQARQPVDRRHRPARRLRRQVDGKHHLAAQGRRVMAIATMPAAEATIGGDFVERRGRASHVCQKRITERMLLPSCISSKAWLMSSSPIVWVMKVSRGISPLCARST